VAVHFGAVRVMLAKLAGPYVIVWLVGTSPDGLYLLRTRRVPLLLFDSPIDEEENLLWATAPVKLRIDSEPPATKTVTYQFPDATTVFVSFLHDWVPIPVHLPAQNLAFLKPGSARRSRFSLHATAQADRGLRLVGLCTSV